MVNKPIKLQGNFNLYSGDIITINNSNPLLVEVENEENQTIKLRNIKDDKYLKKSFFSKINKSLDFSADFKDALVFTVKKNKDDEISLQRKDKYLELDDKEFRLSSEEKWLTVDKQKDIENVVNYSEEIIEVNLCEEKIEKIVDDEKSLIVRDFHDNKSGNSSKHTFKFTESKQKEHSFTWSNDFTLGVSVNFKLTCSSVAGIDISGQFQAKSGTSNTVKETVTETTEKSLEVICPPWKKMQVVSEIKKTKLTIPYIANIKRKIGGTTYKYLIDGEYSCEESLCGNSSNEEIVARNILLVGCTGSGKSTLAKVLSGDDRFEEGSGSVSKTKFFKKSDEFKWKENDYYVIDNIGFGDTKLSEREELIRIGKAINAAYQGLSHVLFVFGGRFSDKEKEGFQKLAALKITNSYITLVRSKFVNFGNKEACEKDREALAEESPEISQLLNNCRGILHIDNGKDRSRNKSQKKVLDYLNNNCGDNPFKPKEWEDISVLIEDYLKDKKKLENEKSQVSTDQKEAIEQQIDILKENTAAQVKEKIQGEEINEVFQLAQIVHKEK